MRRNILRYGNSWRNIGKLPAWTLLQQSFYEELTIANLQAILMTEYEEAGMTEEEAKAAYEAYKNGLIETHQDQITYYLDAS